MRAQIRLLRIAGIELGLHYSWFVIALLITFSLAAHFRFTNPDWSRTTVWATALITGVLFFGGLFLHELSHAFVAKARGLPIRRITLFVFGGMAQIEKEATDAKTEFWMGIAGPIASFVLGGVLLGIALLAGWRWQSTPHSPGLALVVWLGYINLLLGAFNMIPGFPLDGGRVLRALIWWATHSMERATRIAARVGQFVALLFIAYGIFRFFAGAGLGGLWMAFIGWFLLQAAGASYLQMQSQTLLRGVRVRDLMTEQCDYVPAGMAVRDFVNEHLWRTGRRCFLVTEGERTVGIVTPHEVKGVPSERWPEVAVRDIMRPLEKVRAVRPETAVLKAIDIMSREDINQLPVIRDGHVEGLITRAQILQLLQARAELMPEEEIAA